MFYEICRGGSRGMVRNWKCLAIGVGKTRQYYYFLKKFQTFAHSLIIRRINVNYSNRIPILQYDECEPQPVSQHSTHRHLLANHHRLLYHQTLHLPVVHLFILYIYFPLHILDPNFPQAHSLSFVGKLFPFRNLLPP